MTDDDADRKLEADLEDARQPSPEVTSLRNRRRPFVVGMLALSFLSVSSFVLAGCAVVRQTQAEAERQAEEQAERKAADASTVSSCYEDVVSTPVLLSALVTLEVLATNSVAANRSAIRLEPDSELNPRRQKSLDRLEPRLPDLALLVTQTRAARKTIAECDDLGEALDVNTGRMRADALEAIKRRAQAAR